MEMRTRMDGTGRMAAEVWTGAARSAGASVNEMQLNSLVEGGETRCVLSVRCPHDPHACVLAPPPETQRILRSPQRKQPRLYHADQGRHN